MDTQNRILIDTRDLIGTVDKWIQGIMETPTDPPRRCLLGAICTTTGIDETKINDNPITAEVIAHLSLTVQNRPDGKTKLEKFIPAKDIAQQPPSDTDWIVGFNDYSRHDEVLHVLDTAIAASEPCQECDAPLAADDVNLVTINNQPEQVLCGQCLLSIQKEIYREIQTCKA